VVLGPTEAQAGVVQQVLAQTLLLETMAVLVDQALATQLLDHRLITLAVAVAVVTEPQAGRVEAVEQETEGLEAQQMAPMLLQQTEVLEVAVLAIKAVVQMAGVVHLVLSSSKSQIRIAQSFHRV
jgi:hypothetical protein